jgi:serine/threonine protein kinase
MFRIVEDDMPPIPDGCSDLLVDFLHQCFHKDPTKRPTAEVLCEHEWLKKNWVVGKELRQQDSIPFLRRVSTDLQKSSPSSAQKRVEAAETTLPGRLSRGIPPRPRLAVLYFLTRIHWRTLVLASTPLSRLHSERVRPAYIYLEACLT